MESSQTAYAQYTIKNEGMVSIFDFEITPDNSNAAIKVEVPFTKIPEIKALQTIVVPVKITLIHASCESASIKHKGRYVCASGIWVAVDASDVRIMSGNMCPSAPAVTPYGAGGGWGQPLVFGGGSLQTISKLNTAIPTTGSCQLGCNQCEDKYADGKCYPKPNTTPPAPCRADNDACTDDVCENGICTAKPLPPDIVNPITKAYSSVQCPNRRQRDNYAYELDGCTGVPDQTIFPLLCIRLYWDQFTNACNTHDKNYQTCYTPASAATGVLSKEQADLKLKSDMKVICDSIPSDSICKNSCYTMMDLYYVGLAKLGLGQTPYQKDQDNACQCCP